MAVNVWDWLRRGGTPWQDSCAAGAPVPTQDFCAALDCDSMALTETQPGQRAVVACLQNPAGAAACKLSALGVLPGVELRIVQRYPVFVFRIGHAEFAIDGELARHVRVHLHP